MLHQKILKITFSRLTETALECYMSWFSSLISKNYIFKHFVKIVEATSLKFCTVLKLLFLHLQQTITQAKCTNYSNAHVQIFVLLNGEMVTVSTFSESSTFWCGHFGLSST